MRAAERDAKVAAAVAARAERTPQQILIEPLIRRAQRRANKADRRGLIRPPVTCYMKCGTGKPFKMLHVVEGPGQPPALRPCCPDCIAAIRRAHTAAAIQAQIRQGGDKIDRAIKALAPA